MRVRLLVLENCSVVLYFWLLYNDFCSFSLFAIFFLSFFFKLIFGRIGIGLGVVVSLVVQEMEFQIVF